MDNDFKPSDAGPSERSKNASFIISFSILGLVFYALCRASIYFPENSGTAVALTVIMYFWAVFGIFLVKPYIDEKVEPLFRSSEKKS